MLGLRFLKIHAEKKKNQVLFHLRFSFFFFFCKVQNIWLVRLNIRYVWLKKFFNSCKEEKNMIITPEHKTIRRYTCTTQLSYFFMNPIYFLMTDTMHVSLKIHKQIKTNIYKKAY